VGSIPTADISLRRFLDGAPTLNLLQFCTQAGLTLASRWLGQVGGSVGRGLSTARASSERVSEPARLFEFGDGYFNAVLVELIKESDLARYPEIAEVMRYSCANAPHREGGAFEKRRGNLGSPDVRRFLGEAT
jgi:hypothetical protein